jgi:hypothetical protein
VTDPDVRPADLDVRLADPHSAAHPRSAADPHIAADPDSAAGTGPAAAAEAAPSGVVSTEDMPEAATRAMPTDERPEADSLAHPPVGDSLRAQVAGLDGLDELDELPVADHIERYEAVHDELHAALRGIHDPGG